VQTWDHGLGVWVQDTISFDPRHDRRPARADGWQNYLTGLGTSLDKAHLASFQFGFELDHETCAEMITKDDIAGRIASARPNEMLRKGYELKIADESDADLATEFAKQAEELNLDGHIRDALIWGGGLGGSVMMVGADDGQKLSEPLNEERIRSVDFLNVIDCRYARPSRYYADPNQPNFGRPSSYWITNVEGGAPVAEVHESRVIRFGGALTDIRARRRRLGWDFSVLQKPYDKMKQFDQAFKAAGHMLTDASQGVYSIAGLFQMIASGQRDALQSRMSLLDENRSVARALVLDKDGETFDYKARSFAGLPEVLDKFMLLLASAAEMPVAILMGRSPAGMNATGESDFQAWYDVIAADQTHVLLPKLKRLYKILALAKAGPSGGKEVPFAFKFRPLKEMTDAETATLRKTTAETDQIYITAAVLTPEEVALSRFGKSEWSPETEIDVEARQEAQEAGESFEPYPADPDDVPGGVEADPNAQTSEGPTPDDVKASQQRAANTEPNLKPPAKARTKVPDTAKGDAGGTMKTCRANVGKGLTDDEARKMMLRKFPGDYRGFTYDPKTGEATIT
jgi:phage-related protein (TIGR01555 family)